MKKHVSLSADKIWIMRGWLVILCVAAVWFGAFFISHAEPTKGSITGTSVNVREKASTTSTALETLSANDLVDVLAETTGDDGNKWYKVTTASGNTGYVRSDFIKKATVTVDVTDTEDKEAYIAGASANIRQDASTSSGRVATAQGGSKVTIIGEATGADGYKWYQIEFVGNGSTMTGFIRSDLVTFQAPVQEPEVTEIEGEMGEGSEPSEEPSEQPSEEPESEEPGETKIPVSGSIDDLVIMEPASIVEILPEGFEQTELQLGEEIFTVWGKGQFYIMYASANGGTPQFYLYDTVSKSYVSYTGLFTQADVAVPEEEEEPNYKLFVIIEIVIIVILALAIGVLAYKLMNAGYRDDDDDDDDDDDYYDDDDDDDDDDNDDDDDDDEDDFVDLSDDDLFVDVNLSDNKDAAAVSASQSDEDGEMVYTEESTQYKAPSEMQMASEYVSYAEPEQQVVYELPADEAPVYEAVTEETPVYEEPVYEEAVYEETAGEVYAEETEDSLEEETLDDDFMEEEYEEPKKASKSKKAKKEKKKLSKRFLDYFTVEVEEDDEDLYDEDDSEPDDTTDFEEDDDLNFIDL